jgi:microsomal epoxide hydrolase
MGDYSKLPPSTKLQFTPFKSKISDEQLQKLKQLIELSPIAPPTFENLQEDGQYGVTRKWLMDAQRYWANEYSW